MFISSFGGSSGGLGGVFCSKLAPVDCKTDREIEGELLEYGVKIPRRWLEKDYVLFRKLIMNMPEF